MRAGSVFNFFRPGYVPPATAMAANGQVAPEFQIVNETSVSGYLNFMQNAIRNGIFVNAPDLPQNASNASNGFDIACTYANLLPLVADATALVRKAVLLLSAGQVSAATQGRIVAALNTTPVTASSTAAVHQPRRRGRAAGDGQPRIPRAEVTAPAPRNTPMPTNPSTSFIDPSRHTRRAFLRRSAQAAATGTALPFALNLAALGEAAAFEANDYKALVCVFLYGGNDYANTVVPYDSARYAQYATIRGGGADGAAGGIALGRGALGGTVLQPASDRGRPAVRAAPGHDRHGRPVQQRARGGANQRGSAGGAAHAGAVRQCRPPHLSAAPEALFAQRPAVGVAIAGRRRLHRGLGR